MKNLAPIVLFCYNRLAHLQQTIEALQNNTLAKDSELFIFSDGAKVGQENYVDDIRKYLKTVNMFKNVVIEESSVNKGVANSVIDGVTKVVNKYGKVIVLEDDILVSPYFLQYMNDALEMYQEDESVGCISGYTYPTKEKLPDSFFIRGANCWGWATWKRAWNLFEKDGQKLLEEIKVKNLQKDFNFNNSYPYFQMLKNQIEGLNNSWAIRWHASLYLKNKLFLYMNKSIVQNIGFDNSGTHCGNDNRTKTEQNNEPIKIKKI